MSGYHTEAFRVKTNKLPKLLVTKSQLVLVFHFSIRDARFLDHSQSAVKQTNTIQDFFQRSTEIAKLKIAQW